MLGINRGGHFLLIEAVKETALQNRLIQAVSFNINFEEMIKKFIVLVLTWIPLCQPERHKPCASKQIIFKESYQNYTTSIPSFIMFFNIVLKVSGFSLLLRFIIRRSGITNNTLYICVQTQKYLNESFLKRYKQC